MPYIGNTIRAADDYRLIDDISSGFGSGATTFALQVAGSAPVPFPKSPQQILISVNGVIQQPDPTGTTGFNLVGTNIVFSSAPTAGHDFFGIIYATADYLNSGGNFPTGSLGAPSITFVGDEDTGIYRKGSGSVGFVSNATEIANFDSNGITISSGNIIIPDSIIHNGDPNTKIRFPDNDEVSIETGGSERLRVNSDGKVGIGIATSPDGLLHVHSSSAGSVTAASDANDLILESATNVGLSLLTANNSLARIKFGDPDDTGVGGIIYNHQNDKLQLNTSSAARLIIGSDMISARTDYGILRTTGGYTFRETNEGSVRAGLHSNSSNDLIFKAGSASEKMRITANGGKVGIGTTSPAKFFHVVSSDYQTARFESTASNADGSYIEMNANSSSPADNDILGLLSFRGNNSAAENLSYAHIRSIATDVTDGTEDGEILFHTRHNGTFAERIRINSAGLVLVGHTADKSGGDTNALLQLFTPAAAKILLGREDSSIESGNFLGIIDFHGTDGTSSQRGARIAAVASGTHATGDKPTDLVFQTTADGAGTSTERMRISSAGNVGIATTSGGGKLAILSNSSSYEGLELQTPSGDASGEFHIGVHQSGSTAGRNIVFKRGGADGMDTESMRLDNNGKLLLGQNSDSDGTLCMAGVLSFSPGGSGTASTSNVRPNISRGADGQLILAAGKDSTSSIRFDTATNGSTNAAERMRLDSSGKLRFGSSSLLTGFAGSNSPKLQVSSIVSGEWAGIASAAYTSDNVGGRLILAKSRSGATGTHTVVQNGDQVGLITWEASDGTDFHRVAQIETRVNGTVGSNVIPGLIEFSVARSNAGSPTAQMTLNGADTKLALNNNTFLEIPHDERCIVFDEGQKMITSNDGQGNFNIIGGKNHDAVHVSSASGNSGIVQLELNSDGASGSVSIGVGPQRAAGQSALFTNGLTLTQATSGLNNFNYVTGASITSPSGLGVSSGQKYAILNRGNCHDGSWNTENTAQFKVLGDGGSASLTTNDGGGNCNVCFNHASETPDTNGSSWRITVGVDSSNASMHFMSNGNTTNGQSAGVTSRLEITSAGVFVGSSTNNISDVRLKKNIGTITDATTKIKGLIGRTFEWKDEADLDTGTQYGFIAQEMETVVSDLVSDGTSFGLRAFDKDGNLVDNINHDGQKEKIVEYSKGVNMTGVVPILVEALKEAIGKIETLETKVAALEAA